MKERRAVLSIQAELQVPHQPTKAMPDGCRAFGEAAISGARVAQSPCGWSMRTLLHVVPGRGEAGWQEGTITGCVRALP